MLLLFFVQETSDFGAHTDVEDGWRNSLR